MNDFTASNGDEFVKNPCGSLNVDTHEASAVYLSPAFTGSLREFFQAEADERLGRWRWPADGGYVVYPLTDGVVAVLEEQNGTSDTFTRGQWVSSPHGEAAHDYFAAHPEPKPWHGAEAGEVWALTIGDDAEARAWMAEGDGPRFWRGGHSIDRLSGSISAGRRIWPEVAS